MLENKFEFLFEDARRRQQYQQKVCEIVDDKECTFRPNISMSRKKHASIDIPKTKQEPKKFNNGQSIDKERFKPKIGRPPKNDRNKSALPIGEYLYEKNKEMKEHMNKMKEDEIKKAKADCNFSFTGKESNQIIEGRKGEIFKEVFNLLDNDEDGIISYKSIDTSSSF